MADKRLIDANVVINDIRRNNKENFNRPDWSSRQVCALLREAPAVEAVPVVHGHWEWDTEDIYKCTNCGEKSHVKEVMGKPDWNYCPNCGADMRGGAEDGC